MYKIISVHSFRGGTGKSNTTANVATLLAAQGKRVGVVDTDIQSPGIHVLFGFNPDNMKWALNDYLWGKCDIRETAYDITETLGVPISGKIFLIPSSIKAGEIARVVREGYDVGLLNDGFHDLVEQLNLDILMIDTHPGLNEETLLSIAISDALAIVMRPDSQDFQGTGVTVEVARKLDVPRLVMVVNKVPPIFTEDEVKKRVEQTYNVPVVAVLPHSDEMMILASEGIFVLRYPLHPITEKFKQLAAALIAE
ncbi:MAG: MinD/ParA family protein [Chloroflexi bacterium]|jgi:MinD-like ATPase involved in chromosome partitioning or flagellar assembly|nr:MinD/ParA family protein [Chloroflexota bacterium]